MSSEKVSSLSKTLCSSCICDLGSHSSSEAVVVYSFLIIHYRYACSDYSVTTGSLCNRCPIVWQRKLTRLKQLAILSWDMLSCLSTHPDWCGCYIYQGIEHYSDYNTHVVVADIKPWKDSFMFSCTLILLI